MSLGMHHKTQTRWYLQRVIVIATGPNTNTGVLMYLRRVQGFYFVLVLASICSPNEDFGRPNKPSGTSFRRTFQGREYSIWAKNRWKVRRKDVPDGLFGLPKSSFGEHKLCKMIPKDMLSSSCGPCSEQKIAQFRTHYLTKEIAYVSTQQSGYFPIDTEMI